MDKHLQDAFLSTWDKYFPMAQLPIAFFYIDHASDRDFQDLEESFLKTKSWDTVRKRISTD